MPVQSRPTSLLLGRNPLLSPGNTPAAHANAMKEVQGGAGTMPVVHTAPILSVTVCCWQVRQPLCCHVLASRITGTD